ncbi:MAG: hypothetical protein JO266_10185 [Acidobacteria bacterium]|nr:hypothetical protein [Acidobacteriota bacterium]MBV9481465.1 hypothetical protein [Acidobacteriota bacterium]
MTVRRLKSYTGSQGYVYQYYFVGSRPALAAHVGPPATEYVFDVTSDRRITFSVSIFLSHDAALAWGASHGRQLTDAEQYAAAKLRLFRGFDEIDNMMTQGRKLRLDSPLLEELLADAGIS